MTAAPRGRAPVAIRAADVALGDLGVDGGKAAAVPRQTRDGVALETDVIELEDQRIGRAAVDARVVTDVVEHLCPQGSRPGQLGRGRLPPVDVASLAEVEGEARATPPLQAVAVTVEAFDGEVLPAPAAEPQLPGLPHAQP